MDDRRNLADEYLGIESLILYSIFDQNMKSAVSGRLPDDDPVSVWVNSFFHDRFKSEYAQGVKVAILDRDESVNAFACINRAICLSRGLLGMIDTEEELHYVLGHEFTHLDEAHIIHALNENQHILSRLRYNETRSDFKPVLDKKYSINPYGGILFFKKLSMQENDPSIQHGRNLDRVINLMTSSKIIDMSELEYATNPLPASITDFGRQRIPEQLIDYFHTENAAQLYSITKLASRLSFHQALLVAKDHHERFQRYTLWGISSCLEIEKDLFLTAAERAYSLIPEQGFSTRDQDMLAALIISMSAGLDMSSLPVAKSRISSRFYSQFNSREDVDHFLSLVSIENMTRLGVAAEYIDQTATLVNHLSTDMLEKHIFHKDGFDFEDYLAAASEICTKISLLFHPLHKEDAYNRMFCTSFLTGLFEFRENDPSLERYAEAGSKHVADSLISITMHNAGIPSPQFTGGPGPLTNSDDLVALVGQDIPLFYTSGAYYIPSNGKTSDGPKDTSYKEGVTPKDEFLARRKSEIEQFLRQYSGDKDELVRKLHDYFYHTDRETSPTRSADLQRPINKYDIASELAEYSLECMFGVPKLANIHEQILVYRAVFPYALPLEFVSKIDAIFETKPVSAIKNKREHFTMICDALFSDETLKERYPFLK